MLTQTTLFSAFLVVACLYGAFSDLFFRRLANVLCLAIAVVGLVEAWLVGGLSMLGLHAAHGAIALVVGMVLFALRWVGGGDAKFYAGIACWFALVQGFPLLIDVCFCAFLALVVWFVVRRLQGKRVSREAKGAWDKMPLGLGIALGAILTRLIA